MLARRITEYVHYWTVKELLELAKHNRKDLPEEIKDEYECGNIVFLPSSIIVETSTILDDKLCWGEAGLGDYILYNDRTLALEVRTPIEFEEYYVPVSELRTPEPEEDI